MNNLEKKCKIAVYIRFAHYDQIGAAIENQKKIAIKYLKQNNLNTGVINYYIDNGISSNSFKCQFNQLVDDYKKDNFDLIITKDLSRLGRGINVIPNIKKFGIPLEKIRLMDSNTDLATINSMNSFLVDKFKRVKDSKSKAR